MRIDRRLLALPVLLTLALAGCASDGAGSDSSATPSASTEASTTQEATASEEATPFEAPSLNSDADAFRAELEANDDGTTCDTYREDPSAFYQSLYADGWSIDMAAPVVAVYCIG